MPLLGTSSNLNLAPRIDIKSIPASATQVTDVIYGTQTWMDRNLGARRVAEAENDVFSYGNYYQWGRPADGHEITVWNGTTKTTGRGFAETTATLAADVYPSYANFIVAKADPFDWLANPASSGDATLWATVSQGPCPTNYHVPTNVEWSTADTFSTGWGNRTEAYNSALKLPSSGLRVRTNGTLDSQGAVGGYWSSSVDSAMAPTLYFNNTSATMFNYHRVFGFAVRCIKN
jgi:uncharacterized protein (TIGR02145 family)